MDPVQLEATATSMAYHGAVPLFLCRWPNGDFSIVKASDREDAIIRLDEFGNAEAAEIHRLRNFMMDFRISDDEEFDLLQVGDETQAEVMRKAYPILDAREIADDDETDRRLLDEALQAEKERVKPPAILPAAKSEMGREIQKVTDMPASLVDLLGENAPRKEQDRRN